MKRCLQAFRCRCWWLFGFGRRSLLLYRLRVLRRALLVVLGHAKRALVLVQGQVVVHGLVLHVVLVHAVRDVVADALLEVVDLILGDDQADEVLGSFADGSGKIDLEDAFSYIEELLDALDPNS